MTITAYQLAKICHEANRLYCWALGDPSQPAWAEAPVWQVESAVAGVLFHLMEPNATPELSHCNWLAQKMKDGWSWSPEKDPVTKRHPCMVNYYDLPEEQKVKDALFMGIVNAMRSQVKD